jgi:arylsulfatase A-like enzyme
VYDAELAHVDAEVGRLLDGIEQSFGDGALRVITADHGIAFDAPRHVKLNYGYDLSTPVLHVPLLVSGLSVQAQVLDGLVSTMDIAPTLANIVRVKKRLPFRGASLVPELFEGRMQRPQTLHHQFFLNERKWQGREPLELAGVRTERYSLVSDRVKGTFELYDYPADYFETRVPIV